MSTIRRETRETRVRIALEPDATEMAVNTTEPFLDHMLETLARYAGFGLQVEAEGDLRHHLIEDVAITLGLAMREAVPPNCRRYGQATVPMDDALVGVAVDIGSRFYYEGPLPSGLYDHFLRSFAENARLTLHVRVLRGRDRHHTVEAAFKATGLALRQGLARGGRLFTAKGPVRIAREET